MRTLMLGAALLALATPALAQRYDAPDYDGDRGYSARDYDRDGDVDAYDRQYRDARSNERYGDIDDDGDIDARDYALRDRSVRDDNRGGYADNGRGYTNDYRSGNDWRPVAGRVAPRRFLREGQYLPSPRRAGLPYAPAGSRWIRLHKFAGLVRDRDRVVIRVIRFG